MLLCLGDFGWEKFVGQVPPYLLHNSPAFNTLNLALLASAGIKPQTSETDVNCEQ